MVRGQYKARKRFRRIAVKTPGGRVTTHYVLRKPKLGVCAVTGQPLNGVPHELPSKMKHLPKTKKRPTRPFGGVLSSKAMRSVFRGRVLGTQQEKEVAAWSLK